MSTSPEASPTSWPATIFGEAPPRGLALAGFDIASAAWLLVCLGVGVARAAFDGIGRGAATADADFWSRCVRLVRVPVEFTVVIGAPLVPILLIASVVSLSSVHSQPRTFRVLLCATVALALVTTAFLALAYSGLLLFWSFD
jgi:hypothetical protein